MNFMNHYLSCRNTKRSPSPSKYQALEILFPLQKYIFLKLPVTKNTSAQFTNIDYAHQNFHYSRKIRGSPYYNLSH